MFPQPVSRSISAVSTTSSDSSLSARGKHRQSSVQTQTSIHSAGYEDWENLKELFARAAERYDADDIPEALPLLRAVIRECHRFLIDHPDPSVVYTHPKPKRLSRSPEGAITPTEERLHRDWGTDLLVDTPNLTGWSSRRRSSTTTKPSRYAELPTAFHAIFGITLFLMGNLVAQDPSIVLPEEPDAPSTYWLAALDVFETGENLPSRVGGTDLDAAEDWRMAIVWGRTLVCLADEKVTHNIKMAKEQAEASDASPNHSSYFSTASAFSMSEPHWPPSSPFHAIAQFRPPVTRRMSLYSASAHDIMVLAMDQFSRGIFHMPHPHYSHSHNPSYVHTPGVAPSAYQNSSYFSSPQAPPSHYASPYVPSTDPLISFSRPQELFTIASEVLGVAERLSSGTQRHYWASWADSVFNQMKNEADMDAWRAPILSARGRCWLVMGSASVDDMEPALEAGDLEVLHTPEAEEAREGLAMAISFFERAKGHLADSMNTAGRECEDVSPLLAEALLVLANLTADENKREELYTRAQAEVGEDLKLDSPDASSGSNAEADADDAMDTSM
ncbi:hypothetical protein BD309DRAFT_872523 [Dichomitus squalens]|nr:hypothetical protein BD309DRAFT_872523 [Dichomitus squalens]